MLLSKSKILTLIFKNFLTCAVCVALKSHSCRTSVALVPLVFGACVLN